MIILSDNGTLILAIEYHPEPRIVIQDNNKHVAIELTISEWSKFKDALPIIMSVWDSHILSPYQPFPTIPLYIASYNWILVNQLDMILQKSRQLFLTQEHALAHYHNVQISSSPFTNDCFVKTQRKIFELNLKELIKYLYIFLYKQKIFKLQNKTCSSCNDVSLSQENHYDGCLADSWDNINKHFDQVKINRDEVCKIVWEIKKKLRLECSQFEVENTVDCYMYFNTHDELKFLVKTCSIPLMYNYLFTELI